MSVETNRRRLLDLFRARGLRVTCFFRGWVAERFAAGPGRRLRSDVGLQSTQDKIQSMFRDFRVTTFSDCAMKRQPVVGSAA